MSLLVDIEKNLGEFNLKIKFETENQTLGMLGASGCGKTMTLKCIAGIEKPDNGRIILDGVTLFDSEKGINLPPQKRQVGLMFQNYALFPNMTVFENIYAGANRIKDKTTRRAKVEELIKTFDLSELTSHYPSQLSGGQQQRVALARLMGSDPKVLLLDEPFSALDNHLRFRLEQDMRKTIEAFGKTVIWVSHDRDEIYRIADDIAIMNNGLIEICGPKAEIFAAPKTRNAALLTGCKNISKIEKVVSVSDTETEVKVYASDWGINLSLVGNCKNLNRATHVGIRMHYVKLESNWASEVKSNASSSPASNVIKCQVAYEVENPFSYTIMLKPADIEPKSLIGVEIDKQTWDRIRQPEPYICLPPESLILLEES